MAADPVTRRFPFPLPNGWYQVAYADELPVGEVRTLHYFGRDLVAFRGDDGEARVLDAHCPHLGAHLGHGGRVVGDRIRCPFHAWEFDGSGRCVGIPYAKRIPPRAEIRPWLVREKNGMVLVHFDKQGRPPAFEVPDVPEYGSDGWTDYFRRDFVIRSQAQDLAENTVDPAHFKYVHGTAELPKAEAWTEGPVFRVNMDYPIVMGGQRLEGSIDISAYGLGYGITRFQGIVNTDRRGARPQPALVHGREAGERGGDRGARARLRGRDLAAVPGGHADLGEQGLLGAPGPLRRRRSHRGPAQVGGPVLLSFRPGRGPRPPRRGGAT
jgi:3-ketosteroid 9alpha-monooxygenase subunit A